MNDLKKMLLDGAGELGIALDNTAADKLLVYKDFLKEYNQKVNLTSIVDDEGIIVKHFLDSLTLLGEIGVAGSTSIIDIGTGAGFPGLVIKIAREDVSLTLVDSTMKKVRFLEEAAKLLSLKNVSCIHARAEELIRQKPEYREGFDYVTARAVTRLPKLSKYCLPYVKLGGEFIAMKGRNYTEELEEARRIVKNLGGEVWDIKEITLPNSDIVHSLIKIRKII
ncbi:MAG: 16S rRNA (guanine(527)-N(7))-methyltransferase RsmG [Defluviitaleaceae bacterium]|nr:16S rRNA (guanine(527)-N(7))-methyltransferase RsmG [Defluviitaleaceae bacterium]